MAIANLAMGPLEEMLEQPRCPNLYWALTNLPNPLVSLFTASQGERVGILQWLFRDLDDSAPMSADELKRFIAFMEKLVERESPKKLSKGLRAWLDERTNNEGMVSAARHRLVEFGLLEAQVRLFPADQVILLDEKRELEARVDDVMKTINLPLWYAEVVGNRYKQAREPLGPLAPVLVADEFVPAVDQAVRARARLDQRIALLRHVEALRLYAAEHNGTLPAKLSDVTVPLPDDPFTGKPFHYEVTGNTAHLRGTRPQGEEKNLPFNIHYEVTLQK
jgi:hypothetical protein